MGSLWKRFWLYELKKASENFVIPGKSLIFA
jgi:hypothetical protein